ncbi:Murein DD-endopeptidase MepM and murein hydrolase activator NlpD, contain LysM domain [Kaistella chaponensis]|uniref:Murein DD-endopeptidase MepM and murein hydrolase activator NlpD, contain LysM domain n=1 Tax=Kaistella chaponensis TaxID=713588 RepID=A0A1N7M5V8_9FLAO|nr:M23 family metallopeptidase [Kaistella chaponensis]SIS81495.1 Murein DD-endopeptidase MepM and murein hydrolase activator NlpD, contain LysM domain [Kaistella chaponensis]
MKPKFVLFFLLIHVFLLSQEKWNLRFYHEINNREISIYADNNEPMPMSSQFDFKLTNLTSTFANKGIVVIPEKTKKFLITVLKEIKPNSSNSFSYTTIYNFGNALQENYDSGYIYSLPYEKGKTQSIFQGYNGKFSHQNEFALDFNLKTGSAILASREGIVVQVVNNNTQNCPNISCAKYNNKILIMHSDGTFADYSHLKFQGAVVKKGEFIKKDQLLGYSGSTGFASGPHLHFAVFMNRTDGKRIFIETKFKTSESEATLLEEGKSYTKND